MSAVPSRPPLIATLVALLTGLLAVPASAIDLWPFNDDDEGVVIWEGRDQFVKLVPRESGKGIADVPNDHPIEVDPDELGEVLGAVQVWREGSALGGRDEALRLFSPQQAALLGRKIAEGLAKANRDQDVAFAVVGLQPAFLIGKERAYIAGRVFWQGGRLNLIIGDMWRTYTRSKELDPLGIEDEVNRHKYPHRIGSRGKALPQPARLMNTAGIAFHRAGDTVRGDWIEIDLPKALAAARTREVPEEIAAETRKVREQAAKLAIERRQMREELARMRKQLRDMQARGAGGGAAASGGGGTASIEQRLSRLETLHRKKLITDEEYRRKREEILGEI